MTQDIYVLSGKVETRKGTSAIEFSGIIKAVAKNVSDLQPGDRVCVLAPNTFRTTERVPAWACHKMLPEESFEVLMLFHPGSRATADIMDTGHAYPPCHLRHRTVCAG